jgi:hypothetical protein
MLPLLLKFRGEVLIENGHLLYRFPELQKRARSQQVRRGPLHGLRRGVGDAFAATLGNVQSAEADMERALGAGGAPLFVQDVGAHLLLQHVVLILSWC